MLGMNVWTCNSNEKDLWLFLLQCNMKSDIDRMTHLWRIVNIEVNMFWYKLSWIDFFNWSFCISFQFADFGDKKRLLNYVSSSKRIMNFLAANHTQQSLSHFLNWVINKTGTMEFYIFLFLFGIHVSSTREVHQ